MKSQEGCGGQPKASNYQGALGESCQGASGESCKDPKVISSSFDMYIMIHNVCYLKALCKISFRPTDTHQLILFLGGTLLKLECRVMGADLRG